MTKAAIIAAYLGGKATDPRALAWALGAKVPAPWCKGQTHGPSVGLISPNTAN